MRQGGSRSFARRSCPTTRLGHVSLRNDPSRFRLESLPFPPRGGSGRYGAGRAPADAALLPRQSGRSHFASMTGYVTVLDYFFSMKIATATAPPCSPARGPSLSQRHGEARVESLRRSRPFLGHASNYDDERLLRVRYVFRWAWVRRSQNFGPRLLLSSAPRPARFRGRASDHARTFRSTPDRCPAPF